MMTGRQEKIEPSVNHKSSRTLIGDWRGLQHDAETDSLCKPRSVPTKRRAWAHQTCPSVENPAEAPPTGDKTRDGEADQFTDQEKIRNLARTIW